MREIKFRVKCVNHKSWEYYSIGDLCCGDTTTENGEGHFEGNWCQYTGLKDKNGVEIYEGDIVRAGTATSRDGGTRDMNVPVEYVRGIFEPIAYVTDDVLEVIGNIYENPELLTSQ